MVSLVFLATPNGSPTTLAYSSSKLHNHHRIDVYIPYILFFYHNKKRQITEILNTFKKEILDTYRQFMQHIIPFFHTYTCVLDPEAPRSIQKEQINQDMIIEA